VLLFALALLRRLPLWPQRAAWPAVAIGGVLTVAVFNICTAFAQLTTSTSRAAVLTFTMPLMSAGLAWWLLGEVPGWYHAVGAALILPSIWLATRGAPSGAAESQPKSPGAATSSSSSA
jgi:drug/metabolite transporter (DMT)-like permease